MASWTRESRERTREEAETSLVGCHSRHHTIFLITACSITITILIASVSLSSQLATASTGSEGSGGYGCTFYVSSGIGYGVILSTSGNTSSSSNSDVRFTFTYNGSLPDTASRLQVYAYNDSLFVHVNELKKNSVLVVEYRGGNPAYYAVKASGAELCRAFVQESTVTPSGEEYRKITVSTKDDTSGWSSGYYVGQGATVVILTGGGGAGGNSGQPAIDWNLSPLGNVAVAVAVTISSLIPFFIVLPDAAKTLSDSIVTKRRRSGGGDLYLSILSVFIPLLCMCVAVLSATAMLNLQHQPIT